MVVNLLLHIDGHSNVAHINGGEQSSGVLLLPFTMFGNYGGI